MSLLPTHQRSAIWPHICKNWIAVNKNVERKKIFAQKDYFISRFLIDKSENVLAVVCIKCEKVLFFVKNTLHYFKGCWQEAEDYV